MPGLEHRGQSAERDRPSGPGFRPRAARPRPAAVALAAAALGCAAAPAGPAAAEASPERARASAGDPGAADQAAAASLRIRVVDAYDRRPLAGVSARAPEVAIEDSTGGAGEVELSDLPPGRELAIELSRQGYVDARRDVEVPAEGVAEIEVALSPQPEPIEGEVITVVGRNGGLADIHRPAAELSGEELQRNLASSVPETLDAVPGLSFEYMGPSATSPTIRGMQGDRVLMLEDGHRTGDIYWTASDHGVMVEPISAQRMEVLRGPASLIYGSNALGGVVNVVRDDVPARRPHRVEGTVVSQFESVNRGLSTGAVARGPAGPLSWYGELSGRAAGDTHTPTGPLEQTDMQVFNLAAGASWDPEWGLVGGAARYYDNAYGVPGEFDGELLPGGHPGGVSIEARRLSGRVQAALADPPGFDDLELRANVTRYLHDEIEGEIGGEPAIGAAFDQTSTDSRVTGHFDPRPLFGRADVTMTGALGLSLHARHLAAGGANPGTRSGREVAAGGFGYGELERAPFRLSLGLRYDHSRVSTPVRTDIRVRTEGREIVKPVEPRAFGALAGSIAALFDITGDLTVGANAARSVRTPRVEELYSDGPHLADFSFDIGSPDLEPEIGLGLDLFARGELPGVSFEVAAYYNRLNDYIYYNPTGEIVPVIREGFGTRPTPVFEAQGDDASFVGAEAQIEWEVLDRLFLDATGSYTRAERRDRGDPLPFIPPLSGSVDARYDGSSFFGSVGADIAAPQRRVPDPVEIGDRSERPVEPTPGYALLNAGLGWRHEGDLADHTVMLHLNNITDRVWRDHLSRIKEIAPQPGRNIRLSYRALL